MGTRCGDLDPAVVLHIQNATGRGTQDMDQLLNKESGLLGLAGKSDIRAILAESAQGNDRADLAMRVSQLACNLDASDAQLAALDGHFCCIQVSSRSLILRPSDKEVSGTCHNLALLPITQAGRQAGRHQTIAQPKCTGTIQLCCCTTTLMQHGHVQCMGNGACRCLSIVLESTLDHTWCTLKAR